jgi:serine/threonine-protein kinase
MYQTPTTGNLLGHVLEGRYRIDSKLGAGGMGDVYKATRLLIGDAVAIKILHAHLASNVQAAERFHREAQTAIRLKHRNIVALYDVGISTAHNVPYLLMELAEGLTLRQVIRQNGSLPLEFAVTVTAQICSALEEAHRLGIIHRDIKPENVIVNKIDNGWHIKILDFGIAKLYNQTDISLTQDGNAMGTPQYMSPEQCLGEALDGRSDLYSTAIVVYEMLCGTVPFKSAAASAVAVHQVQTLPAPPRSINPAIPAQVEAIIMRALEKRRELRQRNAAQFAQELIQAATAAMREGAISAQPEPAAAENVSLEAETASLADRKEERASESPEPAAAGAPAETDQSDDKGGFIGV